MKAILVPVAALGLCMASMAAVAKNDAIASALKDRKGKKVTVMLQSGAEISGKVGEVGNSTLTLNELSGKEYFDAVVDLDDVSAVQFRAREN